MIFVGRTGKLQRFGHVYDATVTELIGEKVRVSFVTNGRKLQFTRTPVPVVQYEPGMKTSSGRFYVTGKRSEDRDHD